MDQRWGQVRVHKKLTSVLDKDPGGRSGVGTFLPSITFEELFEIFCRSKVIFAV